MSSGTSRWRTAPAKPYWNSSHDPKLSNVKPPDKVKCGRCQKVKACNENNFSNKQLGVVKRHVSNNGTNAVLTIDKFVCYQCTGQSRMELCCNTCDEHKSLEEFSKAQRKTPDDAMCMACRSKRDLEDALPEGMQLPSEVNGASDDDDDDYAEYFLTKGVGNMSVAGSENSQGGVSVPRTMAPSEYGWTEQKGIGFATRTTTAPSKSSASGSHWASSTTVTGFDASRYGAPRKATSSVAGSASTSKWAKAPKGKSLAEKEIQKRKEAGRGEIEDGDGDENEGESLAKKRTVTMPQDDDSSSGDDYSD